jgi:O-antigen/teichoic acid export membrane protein
VGTRIVRNVVFGALRVLVVAPIPLFLTPFIISHVGTKGYGTWAVFLALNGLTSLADLGFLGTLTKHVSEHFTNKDYVQLERVINAGFIMYLAAAIVCAGALNVSGSWLISAFFQKASLPVPELKYAIHLFTLAVALNLLAFPFASVTSGLQRLDITHGLSAVNTLVTAVGATIFLATGFGFMGLIYSVVLASSLNLVLYIWLARRILPHFSISFSRVRGTDVKALFSFSLQIYATQIAVAAHSQTEKFLLAHFVGLTPVGWYDIANDLAGKLRNIPSLLLSPLLPAAAELDARGDEPRILELYRRSHKYLAFFGVPVVAVTVLMAHRFIEVWLGPGFSGITMALIFLTIVQFINLASGPGLLILLGKGILGPGVRSAGLGFAANLIFSTVFIVFFGFSGAVYGTSLALFIATASFVFDFHRVTKYPLGYLTGPYIKPVIWAATLTLLCHALVPVHDLRWVGMTLTAVLFGPVYAVGLVSLKYFDAFDVAMLARFIPIPKSIQEASLFA